MIKLDFSPLFILAWLQSNIIIMFMWQANLGRVIFYICKELNFSDGKVLVDNIYKKVIKEDTNLIISELSKGTLG